MDGWVGGTCKEKRLRLTRLNLFCTMQPISTNQQVQRWAHRYRLLRAIDRSLMENGLKMVFLLR